MRQPKETPAQVFDAAESNGARPVNETDINGDPVHNVYQPGTIVNYDRMINLWDEYERRYSGATPHSLQTFKHFVDYCVKGWNATQRMCRQTGERRKIALSTVKQRITDFLATWQLRLENQRIPSEVSKSIYNHIKQPSFRASVSIEKRERHYLTVPHYRILMEHMWTKDWYQYGHGGTQVNDYAIHTLSIYSSSRVGEWIESSARKESGRGVLYKHMNFAVFRNERGEAETAICPVRDAKGMTLSPEGRPQHGMYEDIEPLFACAMLPTLAIALANDAFQDYHSLEQILAIPPPRAGTIHPLRIKEEMLEVPFFQTFDADGPTGRIEKAETFSSRTVNLGHRAGFSANITMHCGRREVLIQAAANGYVKDDRKILAGHKCNVFLSSYASSISTIDGVANFWGLKPRTSHLEAFRGMSLQWHPQMEQSLPAKVQDDLAQRPDLVTLNMEIKDFNEKLKELTTPDEINLARRHRDEVYLKRRQLISDELDKWQQLQSRKASEDQSHVASRPSFFNRVRRLDPARDRLASTLFLNVSLRSKEGQNALQDMMTLIKENPRVAYRPSLRPRDGHCPVESCDRDLEKVPVANRWDHIFGCYSTYLKDAHGFAELCFQCDQWMTSSKQWHTHCQAHFEEIEALPTQFNQVKFRYTPATAAQCPFCLFNLELAPPIRWKQFKSTHEWKQHVHRHFLDLQKKKQGLNKLKPVSCPDPRCGLLFDSITDLQYHCKDTLGLILPQPVYHSIETECPVAMEDGFPGGHGLSFEDKPQPGFVNETVETVSSSFPGRSQLRENRNPRRKRGRSRKNNDQLPLSFVHRDETSDKKRRRPTKRRQQPPRTVRSPNLREKSGIQPHNVSYGHQSTCSNVKLSETPTGSTSLCSRIASSSESETQPEDLEDESLDDSDYEIVNASQGTQSSNNKRKRKGSVLGVSPILSSTPRTATLSMSTHCPSKIKTIPQVIIYI